MPKSFSISKRTRSFVYAFRGIVLLLRSEHNAWVHVVAVVVSTVAGFALNISATEWCIVIVCMGLVLAAEAMNTAIEKLTDKVSPDFNPQAGVVKDLAAGAVLFVAIAAFLVGIIIFVPKL